MMSAYCMDIHVLVPREPAEFPITTALESLQVWHERLGHQDKRHVRKLLEGMEINMSMAETEISCDGCVLGRAFWKPFTPRSERPKFVGELINADDNGLMSVWSLQVAKYYVCFKDDCNKYGRVSSSSKKMNFPSVYFRSCIICRKLVTQ
jgi:hypothetical protein